MSKEQFSLTKQIPLTPRQRLEEIKELREEGWFVDNPNAGDIHERLDFLLAYAQSLEAEVHVLNALRIHRQAPDAGCDPWLTYFDELIAKADQIAKEREKL